VPTEIVFGLWGKVARKMAQQPNLKGLIIDGSPRSTPEAVIMDNLFKELNWQDVKVFLLDISEKEAFNRLTKRKICQDCGQLIPYVGKYKNLEKCDKCNGKLVVRQDDNSKAVQARLDYFNKDVQPAVDYYQKQNRLTKINGEQSIEDVYRDILKKLES